jgi:tRNA pseudouridine(38-40) synthase
MLVSYPKASEEYCSDRSFRVFRVSVVSSYRSSLGISIDITANAFLHHMVRNIAGLLLSIGYGDSAPERVAAVLQSRDRKTNAATAPPDGLYLAAVNYPPVFGLPGAQTDAGNPAAAIIGRNSA